MADRAGGVFLQALEQHLSAALRGEVVVVLRMSSQNTKQRKQRGGKTQDWTVVNMFLVFVR